MKRLFLLFTILISSSQLFAQNPALIKNRLMNNNNISFIAYNYGSLDAPNALANSQDFAWKGLGYMYELGFIVGAEVVDNNGQTIHLCSDSFILSSQGDYDPSGNLKWGWLPYEQDPGFNLNQNGSCPSLSYSICDFTNAEYSYSPSSTDAAMKGLGLITKVTIYQPKGFGSDALIVKYDITNAGTKVLNKVFAGFQADPHIGGIADYMDDRVGITDSSVIVWDSDNRGMGGLIPGCLGFNVLDENGRPALSYFEPAYYGPPNYPKNDDLMWLWMTGGIDTTSPLLASEGDNVVNFGAGAFSLSPGETKTLKLVIALADDQQSVLKYLKSLRQYSNSLALNGLTGTSGGNKNYQIELVEPEDKLTSDTGIKWIYGGNNPNARLSLEYSPDRGISWYPVKYDFPLNETCSWNVSNIPDGMFHLLRIVAYNPNDPSDNYYSVSSKFIAVDKAAENARPEIFLTEELPEIITEVKHVVSFGEGDADDQNTSVKIEYSFSESGPFNTLFSGVLQAGYHKITVDLSDVPSAEKAYIRLTVSDGNTTTPLLLGPVAIQTVKDSIEGTYISRISGAATPDFRLEVADKEKMTGHEYEISFNVQGSTEKLASIKDLTAGKNVVENFLVQPNYSTPVFDGLKLRIEDHEVGINPVKSSFNRPELNEFWSSLYPPILHYTNPPVKAALDWYIVFGDLDQNELGEYLYPVDTVSVNGTFICPFKVFENYNGIIKQVDFAILEKNLRNKRWDPDESIILLAHNPSKLQLTYQLDFQFDQANRPRKGDTLCIRTYRPITGDDRFRFTASRELISEVETDASPSGYTLLQNYPNPFNPSTSIRFNLAKESRVELSVYNTLGEMVGTITKNVLQAGTHTVSWNASSLSSGVYIYRLKAIPSDASKPFTMSRKMLLLR